MADILTPSDVRRIATLARLELTADELDTFAEQLTAILAYAAQVQQVENIAELGSVELRNVNSAVFNSAVPQSREDVLAPCLPRDVLLEQAPDADRRAGVFKVPRVLGS